jgi:hypothetical protein
MIVDEVIAGGCMDRPVPEGSAAKEVNPADPEFPAGYQSRFEKLWGGRR